MSSHQLTTLISDICLPSFWHPPSPTLTSPHHPPKRLILTSSGPIQLIYCIKWSCRVKCKLHCIVGSFKNWYHLWESGSDIFYRSWATPLAFLYQLPYAWYEIHTALPGWFSFQISTQNWIFWSSCCSPNHPTDTNHSTNWQYIMHAFCRDVHSSLYAYFDFFVLYNCLYQLSICALFLNPLPP